MLMENIRINDTSATDQNGVELPSLFKFMESNSVSGFDNSPDNSYVKTSQDQHNKATTSCLSKSSMENMEPGRLNSVSISMPPSPALKKMAKTKRVLFSDRQEEEANLSSSTTGTPHVVGDQNPQQLKFYSQPMPVSNQREKGGKKNFDYTSQEQNRSARTNRLQDKQFDSFKTWSGKLERQMSNLVGKPQEQEQDTNLPRPTSHEAVPVGRYFDALEGPELEILRVGNIHNWYYFQLLLVYGLCHLFDNLFDLVSIPLTGVRRRIGATKGQAMAIPTALPNINIRYLLGH